MTPQTAQPSKEQSKNFDRSLSISKNIIDGSVIRKLREHQKLAITQLFLSLGLFVCICVITLAQPQFQAQNAQETKQEIKSDTKSILTQLKEQ